MKSPSPIRPTDAEARALAQSLLKEARFGALGVREPGTGQPMVSRIAVGQSPDGTPISLVSDLSHHTRALDIDPVCSLLVGEPGEKGDPLTYPRLTVQVQASFVSRDEPEHEHLRAGWLETHPKSKLYIDFADFRFVRFLPTSAFLNGGFGKAFVLEPRDLFA